MSHYHRNREILETRFPGISAKLDTAPQSAFESTETRDGQISIRSNGTWLHSRHAPVREAQRLIENGIPDNCPFCIFYGFGLAYHLEIFVQKHKSVPFAVVEPDIALFNACLDLRDYEDIFLAPGFSLALGSPASSMPALLESKPHKNIQICMLRPVVENNRDYFEECDSTIQEYLSRKEINANTLNKFSRLWVSNICRNLFLTSRYPGITGLKDHFAGIPALLLAAGPTLEEILPLLEELKQRMLIVCVDTALKACLRTGVEPDFLILTDPQYWNSRHLDRCRTGKTILISDVSTSPPLLRDFQGTVFFCSTPFPLAQYFESRSEIKGKLKSGGSVATAAWDFIRHAGVRRIYCAGLDLSFPDGETHYRGSTFEQRIHGFSHRLSPVETGSWLALMGGNPYKRVNHRQEDVLTDQRMKIYIHWFEEQMRQFPDVTTHQLSPRGIALKGMDWQDPRDLFESAGIRNEIDRRIQNLHIMKPAAGLANLKKAHSQLMSELDDLIALTGKGMKISGDLITKGVSPEALDILNRIDHSILNRESREIAGFILAPILEEHYSQKNSNPSEDEILLQSCSLYSELKKSLEFHRDLISRISF